MGNRAGTKVAAKPPARQQKAMTAMGQMMNRKVARPKSVLDKEKAKK